ncbi:MAG: hypothetical protein LBM70_00220, partial [Victivallales bacterium]|nr:hypothetical protein [Victivallales bacterium]
IRREIIWNARYRVAATEIATFFGQTGTFPAEWPELNCMVTSVKPKQLTDMEYEVDLEVQHRNNPDLLVRYSREDRSDLSHRVDISVDMADFHVTAEMAGYQKQPSGQYMPIPNWENFVACPFICSDKLPNNMIDQTLRCLVITSSRYFSGDAMSRIDELVNWVNTRVTNSYVEGIDGSFLRIRQTCQEVFDDSGELYTRITRSYQKAPREYVWNTNYWASH